MAGRSDRESDLTELPPIDGRRRRELASRGHHLSARLLIGKRGLDEAVIAQIRQALEKVDLVKVRIGSDTGAEADEIGARLTEKVPCHVIKRIGKVLLLYRPKPQ